MKSILPLLLSGAMTAGGQSAYVNFIRQHQQGTSVVWDMPVAHKGESPSALTMDRGGALFQLWTIEQSAAKDHLLDQKLVGAYLPAADVKISTLDPYSRVPRSRVDQPFTVEIHLNGLLSGLDLPLPATSVLLERHIASYPVGSPVLPPPLSSRILPPAAPTSATTAKTSSNSPPHPSPPPIPPKLPAKSTSSSMPSPKAAQRKPRSLPHSSKSGPLHPVPSKESPMAILSTSKHHKSNCF